MNRTATATPVSSSPASRPTIDLRTPASIFLAWLLVVGCATVSMAQHASAGDPPRFVSIVLGSAGGLLAGETSSYLLAPAGSHDFVALDAGTLLTGLRHARRAGSLSHIPLPATLVAPWPSALNSRLLR